MSQPLSDKEKVDIRLKCAEIAIQNGTKVDLTQDACAAAAEKIYVFVTGITKKKAPVTNQGTG